jgi:Mce-associated membrane protein
VTAHQDAEEAMDETREETPAEAEQETPGDTVDEKATAEDVEETATDLAAEASDDVPQPTNGTVRALRTRLVPIVLAVVFVASAGLAGYLYFTQFRPDQQTDADAAQVAIKAASDGTVALLSYSPESLEKDFATAKTHLTGDFLSYYNDFTTKVVTPAAEQKAVKTTATVVRAAVSDLQPKSAEVLTFINQTTTSKENPDGAFAASSVKVGLTKVDGKWLISACEPV